jgi:hypothetical protein
MSNQVYERAARAATRNRNRGDGTVFGPELRTTVAVNVRSIWSEIHADKISFQSFDDFIERAFLVNKKEDQYSYDYLVNALQKGSRDRGAGNTLKLSKSLVNDYINKNGKFAITLANGHRAEPTVYLKLNDSFAEWTKAKTNSGKDVNVGDTEFLVTHGGNIIWKLFKDGERFKEQKYSFVELVFLVFAGPALTILKKLECVKGAKNSKCF